MFRGQQCQTDLSGLEMDIWMTDWCYEFDLWGCERIVLGNFEREEPEATCIRRGLVSGTFEDCFPAKEIVVVGWTEMEDCVVG